METLRGTDGRQAFTRPEGTVVDLEYGPDPRWGMQSPIFKLMSIRTPGGLTKVITMDRSVTLLDPNNPFHVSTITGMRSIGGQTYTSIYNAGDSRIVFTTPEGLQVVSEIDTQGRVVQKQFGDLYPISFTYDSRGRVETISQGTGSETRTFTLAYDSQGFIETLIDPISRTLGFERDPVGRIIKFILMDGRFIDYSYDANGNITSVMPPGRPSHTFVYTSTNLLQEYNPPDIGAGTNKTTMTYNNDQQLVLLTRPDGNTISLSYDSSGRLASISIPRGTITYSYDPSTGYPSTITTPDGAILSFSFDGMLGTQMAWQGTVNGSINFTYDNNFRILSRNVNGGSIVDFSYNKDGFKTQAGDLSINRDTSYGLITGTTIGNVADAWDYNGFGEIEDYTALFMETEIFAIQYNRDKLGRIVEKLETVDGASDTFSFTYDLAGQLTEVQKNSVSIANYTYDSNGNRLSFTEPGNTISGTYDDQDRLIQYGNSTYTYTANGELVSKITGTETTTYTYDVFGNLMNATLPDGTQVEYLIDGANRRIGKKVNGVLLKGYLYKDGLNPVAELDGNGNIVADFIYATKRNVPDYMRKGGGTYRIISDHLGSPRIIINTATGSIAQRLDYDAFGNVIADSNPGFQPFGFAGGLSDQHTGLTRFGARDYDAETGRWTAKDPILFNGSVQNLFTYVKNDPVNISDVSGLANPRIQGLTNTRLLESAGDSDNPKLWEAALNEVVKAQEYKDLAGDDEVESFKHYEDQINEILKRKSKLSLNDRIEAQKLADIFGLESVETFSEIFNGIPNPPAPGGGAGGTSCKYNIWKDSNGNIIMVVTTPW
jgi:RHS repeat-associated protein